MKSVKIKKDELLGVIQANRVKHSADFLEAQDKYRVVCIQKLTERIQKIQDSKLDEDVDMNFSVITPTNKTDEYDRVIKMLEMSTEDVVELTSHEFDCYVRDNWDWSDMAKFSNSTYTGRK